MIEGFDGVGLSDWTAKYPGAPIGPSWPTLSSPGPGGSGSYVVFDSGGTGRFGMPCPNGANGLLVVGFALNMVAAHATNTRPILRFRDALTADQCGVHLTPARQLAFYRGATLVATSTFQLTLSAWVYVEVKVVFGASGGYEIRVGGSTVLSGTGVNTISTANASADLVFFGNVDGASGPTIYLDDIYVDNAVFMGECRVSAIRPNADGTYLELTPSTGTAHFSRVDEINGADGESVYGASAGLRDTFGLTDITAGATVAAVQVQARMRSDGTRGGTTLLRTNGTDVESSPVALSTTATFQKTMYQQNPVTSTDWTAAEVNALEVGFKITS